MSEPRLPPELERKIFQIALRGNKNIVDLMLTAKRVYTWLTPLLYESIVIERTDKLDQLLRTIDTKVEDPQFFARIVRQVSVTRKHFTQIDKYNPHSFGRVLEACSNTIKLVLSYPDESVDPFYSVFSKMHLKHIHACHHSSALLRHLQASAWKSLELPLFHSLTHLRMTNFPYASDLDCLYGLTHFAMGTNVSGTGWGPSQSLLGAVVGSLLQRTGPEHAVMEVVIIYGQFGTFDHIKDPVSSDYRLVNFPPHDESEFWEEAEDIVRKRKLVLSMDGGER